MLRAPDGEPAAAQPPPPREPQLQPELELEPEPEPEPAQAEPPRVGSSPGLELDGPAAPGPGLQLQLDGGAAAAPAPAPAPARLKRRVSFAESLQERVADGDANPVALEHAEGPLKGNDGPSVDSALLDRLIVAFFEKGNIRSAEGVVAFVGAPALEQSGSSVAQRLEAIVETLRSGSRVGLLPSNARLGPEHSVRLARLLEYVSEALS